MGERRADGAGPRGARPEDERRRRSGMASRVRAGHRGFGSRTPTFFCSGANQARATRGTSAAVTARILLDEGILERVAADHLETGEQRGAAVDGILLEHERGLDLVLGARQLLVGHRLGLEPLHVLASSSLLERLRRLARHRRRPEPEEVRVEREVGVVAARLERQLALVDEVCGRAARRGRPTGSSTAPRAPAASVELLARHVLRRGRRWAAAPAFWTIDPALAVLRRLRRRAPAAASAPRGIRPKRRLHLLERRRRPESPRPPPRSRCSGT